MKLISFKAGSSVFCWVLVIILFNGFYSIRPSYSDETLYSSYNKVLVNFVDSTGMVDYKNLKSQRTDLDAFLKSIAEFDSNEYNSWTDAEKIAFYINVYNAITLKSIIDNYPIQYGGIFSRLKFPQNSIRQISGVWDRVEHQVMKNSVTLNDIEHNILRKQFNEPRIHMALVCASMSCPSLRNEPFIALKLNDQLNDQSRLFFSNPQKFKIDRNSNKVYLSKIFDWYGQDFQEPFKTSQYKNVNEKYRSILNFSSQYLSDTDVQYLQSQSYTIEFLDYDWSLNEQKAN